MAGATQTDVLVVGSGVAGLAAAVSAAERGAAVMVCEKQRALGGTSNFFQGTFAVESELQRAAFVRYTRDEAFKNIMEYSHWRADARLVRAIVDRSAETIAWLQGYGVEFAEVMNNMPDAPRTYHLLRGGGEAVVKALASAAKARGVDIRTAAPVTGLLKTGGAVNGAIVDLDGEEVDVATGAVVVASGGYAANKEWLKRYGGFDLGVNVIPMGNVGKMGDGIRMAWEAGAGECGVEVLELFRVGPIGPGHEQQTPVEYAGVQPELWVDTDGRRFCDETIGFYETSVGNASARTRQWCNYTVFDTSAVERLATHGIDKAHGPGPRPGSRLLTLQADLERLVAQGDPEVLGADSVAELAGKMGVPSANLESTVAEYNRFCAQRHDDLFAKDPAFLRALVGPRFYAIRARTICLGTMGGIRINEACQALDASGKTIPGLYAAGYDAGGMYGDSYPIRPSSGLSSAFAINSGRLAGENAARQGRDAR
jgi:fumarate reductase flavoprotein subunit